ncbi:helix-turn-helix domain-containing protein [Microvirga tunisiensis]|uniref:Helix-turn-helix domain-containing protein n=1 Tax=Pannonibacter tanglangensis TaxID=2750084 RepID=A0A7X5F2V8_9HYPH|nr:AraC family transcriptional regulator [Pannonibacter sp. XCT-53]NBN77499.1 helix-turn-helix domain-containing protein [Pannonibacter sp. XCT-53]
MTDEALRWRASDRVEARATALRGAILVDACSRRSFSRHTHDVFGIGVVLGGAQESASGRGLVRAEAGHVISLNPGEVHDGAPLGDGPRHWRMIFLDPEALAQAFAGNGVSAGTELAFPVLPRPLARHTVLSLQQALLEPVPDTLAIDGLLVEAVAHLLDRDEPLRIGPADPVWPARQAIEDDPAADRDLAELARMCGLSRFHFLRAFRAATGLPPHAFRIQKRLQAARRMVLAGLPLSEAAAAAGFADQAHFTRHFVRAHGHTPGLLARLARGSGKRPL